ncbi:MAG: hypothetical protein AB7N76_00855 [Planctomycetota bacterium]
MRTTLNVAVAACLALSAASVARADEWVELGERKVNFDVERDTIPVGASKVFTSIRLQVVGAPIRLLDLKVHFKNGETQDVAVRDDLNAGSYTRTIDLEGKGRLIDKITMVYKTKARGPRVMARASVKVFGKGAGGGGAREDDDKGKAKTEWVHLGQRKVSFGADRDEIDVTVSEGIFKRIRLHVEDNEVELWDLKVHFGNGDTQDVQVRKHFAAGSNTREIDLEGTNRVIKKVVLLYKSKLKPAKGRATVKLWGERILGAERPKETPKQGGDRGGDWENLGSRQVDWAADKDTIMVTVKDGLFTKLRFHVNGNKIRLHRMKVVFGNGQEQEVQINKQLDASSYTPTLDLPGEKRIIQKVVFWYETVGRGPRRMQPKATLTLWGKR